MVRRTVQVRRACVEDVDELIDLAATFRADTSLERSATVPLLSRERLEEVLGRTDAEVHLASVEGDLAGAVLLRAAESLLTGGAVLRVEQLYVAPRWRRRGVGHQLLGSALATAEGLGAEEVSCAVTTGGRDAHRFLARLGFTRVTMLRSVPVARLRARLAGEREGGRRRVALDALVARRRRQLDRPETPASGLPAVRTRPLGAVAARGGTPDLRGSGAPERLSAAGRRAGGR